MAHLPQEPKGFKRQLSDRLAFKERVEQPKDDEKDQSHHSAGFELEEREVSARFLEAGLDAVDLLGFGLLGDLSRVRLHGLQLLRSLVDGGSEGLVGVGAVD